jgi:hypothetical protein
VANTGALVLVRFHPLEIAAYVVGTVAVLSVVAGLYVILWERFGK